MRRLNSALPRVERTWILYWMTAYRRTEANASLDRAAAWAQELGRPLLVLEALRADYPWASHRHHQFIMEGMADNARRFDGTNVRYYPYVEPDRGAGRGLLQALGEQACVIVTDDWPGFFVPRMATAAATRLDALVEAVDDNGVVPLRAAGKPFARAVDFRRYLHGAVLDRWDGCARSTPLKRLRLPTLARVPRPILQRWPPARARLLQGSESSLAQLPIDPTVPRSMWRGGLTRARQRLRRFLRAGLGGYAQRQSSVSDDVSSGLSPYLHFGHVGVREVFAAVASSEQWTPDCVRGRARGRREGFWQMSPGSESFLDQLLTWRELSYGFCFHRPDYAEYASLPEWARRTLDAHRRDPRPYLYRFPDLEAARTHDELWNCAQRQLVHEGTIQRSLRMLWGKKIIEWTQDPEEAWRTAIALNDRYALDGRDPNTYGGIGWCFGRFDRPWGPERPIFGLVRYMSSDSARRKWKVQGFLKRWEAR